MTLDIGHEHRYKSEAREWELKGKEHEFYNMNHRKDLQEHLQMKWKNQFFLIEPRKDPKYRQSPFIIFIHLEYALDMCNNERSGGPYVYLFFPFLKCDTDVGNISLFY